MIYILLLVVVYFVFVCFGVWLGRVFQRKLESEKRMAFADSSEFKALSYMEQRGALLMWKYLKERP